MKKILVVVMALAAMSLTAFAQTADELKAERQAIKSELNSKDGKNLDKAWAKLAASSVPSTCGINSIDGLVSTNASILTTLVAVDNLLSEYKVSITESKDGEVEIDKFTAKTEDYVAQLPLLVAAGAEAAKAAQQLKDVQNDMKSLNPMTAAGSIKAGNWAVNATDVNVQMIERDTKMLNNLINSCKAAKNL